MEKKILINDQEVVLTDYQKEANKVSFKINEKEFSFKIENNHLVFNNETLDYRIADDHVVVKDLEAMVSLKAKREGAQDLNGEMIAPMPCKVFKILKSVGEEIQEGETLLILEAMKMEHGIKADKSGIVKTIHFDIGELVPVGALLAEIDDA